MTETDLTASQRRWRVTIVAYVRAEEAEDGQAGWREVVMKVPAASRPAAVAVARNVCHEAGATEARLVSARLV